MVKADRAGVVITHTDGDDPGFPTRLRYLRSLGLRPVSAAISSLVDQYRTRIRQRAFDDGE